MAGSKGGSRKGSKKSGGSLMSMRSGFKSVTGTSRGSGRRGKKKEVTFWNVFAWVVGIALIGVLVWSLRR